MDECLSIDFAGVRFINPFTIAASPASNTRERLVRAFNAGWGAAVLKTTSVEQERVDLVYPMMGDVRFGTKRRMGFVNIDLISERHINEIEEDIRYLKAEFPDRVLIGSIMAGNRNDWIELVQRIEEAGADMIECSMSCPQGDSDGAIPAANADLTYEVTRWISQARRRNTPIIVKLTPNVTDITAIAKAAERGGANAVCAIDTVKGFGGIDLDNFEPKLSVRGQSTLGGLSGPVIKPVALACIAELAQSVRIPIAGVGGISDWSDAAEFFCLGATTVQLCTSVMRYGVGMISDLTTGLCNYLSDKEISRLSGLVGKSLPYLTDHDSLDREQNVKVHIDYKKCINDKACYIACRDGGYNAIEIGEDDRPRVDEEKCRGCGVCMSMCPVSGCIRLKLS